MDDVTDLERRAWATLGRAVGNTTNTAVTALLTAHYGFDPQSASVHGAVVGSISEEFVSAATSLRLRRLERFAKTAEAESGELTFDELVAETLHDEQKLSLLLVTSEAASRAADDWKVDTLARIFMSGIDSDDMVETANVIAEVVRQLDPMHLEVMRRLEGEVVRPFWPPLHVTSTERLATNAADDPFGAPPRADLSPVIHTLLAKLQSVGIVATVEEEDKRFEVLQGREGQSRSRTDKAPKQGWALTDFGVKVASFLKSRTTHDDD